jgi:hypothetical protein
MYVDIDAIARLAKLCFVVINCCTKRSRLLRRKTFAINLRFYNVEIERRYSLNDLAVRA